MKRMKRMKNINKKTIIILPLTILTTNLLSATYYLNVSNSKKTQIVINRTVEPVFQDTTSLFTEWADKGIPYDFSEYLPVIEDQTQSFTQTQTNLQDQNQFEQQRQYEENSETYINIGEPIEHERTVTVSNTREITVQAGDWILDGGLINCSDWLPLTSSVLYNQEFQQTRQCDQPQNRDISYYIDSNFSETINFSVNSLVVEQQNAFGSNSNSGWIETDSSFSDWEDVNEGYNYGTWTPEIVSQLNNFNQSISYLQAQIRYEQNREINTFTNEYRNINEPIEHDQVITENENRLITVEVSSFVNNGSLYGCNEWTPSYSGVEENTVLAQSRGCNQDRTATVLYKDGSDLITQTTTQDTVSENENRNVDIIVEDWSNVNSPDCGDWTPDVSTVDQGVSFQQERSCTQDQSSTIRYEVNSSIIDTVVKNRTENTTETQTAVGEKSLQECHNPADGYFVSQSSAGDSDVKYYSIFWANQYLGDAPEKGYNIEPNHISNAVIFNGYLYWNDVFITGLVCRHPLI